MSVCGFTPELIVNYYRKTLAEMCRHSDFMLISFHWKHQEKEDRPRLDTEFSWDPGEEFSVCPVSVEKG